MVTLIRLHQRKSVTSQNLRPLPLSYFRRSLEHSRPWPTIHFRFRRGHVTKIGRRSLGSGRWWSWRPLPTTGRNVPTMPLRRCFGTRPNFGRGGRPKPRRWSRLRRDWESGRLVLSRPVACPRRRPLDGTKTTQTTASLLVSPTELFRAIL